MDTKELPRVIAWAQVEKTWKAGSASCLQCPYRLELTSPPAQGEPSPISVQCCGLLAEGTGNDFLNCPSWGAPDPAVDLEERARSGFCVAIQPRGYRDLFHDPAPILIGSAYVRRLDDQGASADRLQAGLLESRTARRPPLLLGLVAQFWNVFC